MQKIHKLSADVISKIAAGEVIERPAYAVKELIENSLDAGATKIIVKLVDYGLSEISVFDNGVGMNKEDLLLASLPHTTSKIKSESDLEKIISLGFRGEALSSIAAIADIEVKSKIKNAKSGYTFKLGKVKPVGMPEGTEIIIKNIFANTPARRKFLHSELTEYKHLLSQIESFSLARPDVEFQLFNNKKQIFNFKKSSLLERINEVLGEELSSKLFLLKNQNSYVKISGFITHPQIRFKNNKKMFVFVNSRRVLNPSLLATVKESFLHLLMDHDFPASILNIEIPTNVIDVNVHPKKEIIKFTSEQEVNAFTKESIERVLLENNLTFNNLSFKNSLTKSQLAKELKAEIFKTEEYTLGKIKRKTDIIQLHNLYLVCESENGIVLFDQHAVHEAILYYKFKKAFLKKKNSIKKFIIKKPLLLTLNPSQSILVLENKDKLKSVGFDIEEFGENIFKLSKVPLIETETDPKLSLLKTLETLELANNNQIDSDTNVMLSYLACRSAIKSGQKLTKKEMKELIKYLDKIDFGYTCPHGRPVKIELSKSYLSKLFMRS